MTDDNVEPFAAKRAPPFSEDDLALRFTGRTKDYLRYVPEWAKWMVYEGGFWRVDKRLQVFDLARLCCRDAAESPRT